MEGIFKLLLMHFFYRSRRRKYLCQFGFLSSTYFWVFSKCWLVHCPQRKSSFKKIHFLKINFEISYFRIKQQLCSQSFFSADVCFSGKILTSKEYFTNAKLQACFSSFSVIAQKLSTCITTPLWTVFGS